MCNNGKLVIGDGYIWHSPVEPVAVVTAPVSLYQDRDMLLRILPATRLSYQRVFLVGKNFQDKKKTRL